MILQTTIDKVFDAADIVAVVSEYVHLKKQGVNFTGPCPFHDEKTPSFIVSPAKQIYKCFGCGAGGNAVKFVMEQEKKNFPEAIEFLAAKYHIEVEKDTAPVDEKVLEEKEGVLKVNVIAVKKYTIENDRILRFAQNDGGEKGGDRKGIEYIHSRFTADDIAQWKIGFAPDENKFLTTPVINAGLYAFGIKSGLLGERDGTGYDKLRNRIIFPIEDRNGTVVGFGARVLPGADVKYAKYLNSNENAAYNKSNILYGLQFAVKKIQHEKFAYLAEGYTDVIAMHRSGKENTVATCGTALTDGHCKLLKRYCSKITLVRDGDAAGLKAAHKDVEQLLQHNFKVDVILFPEKHDPESYLQEHAELPPQQDAVLWRTETFFESIGADPFLKSEAIHATVELLKKISNELLRGEYLKTICKKYKLKAEELKKLFVEKKEEQKKEFSFSFEPSASYIWPDDLKMFKDELVKDVEEFGICMHNNAIYGKRGKEYPLEIRQVSNFSIEIIQHMHDEKFAKKLVRITNREGQTRIFDVVSDMLNTMRGLDKSVTDHGNFLFYGIENDFQCLRKKLFAEMGVGAMIEQLGYQPAEKLWATNNFIIKPDGSTVKIDDYGIYKNGVASYYIPSANKIYRNNHFKYQPQKRVTLTDASVSFQEYGVQMKKVHREHAISGILYTIACVFSDIVYDRLKGFPLVFLHGTASTGKDNMIMACQSIFGQPQAPLNLGNGASTMKAQIRKFAQFVNMAINLSEYRRGDKKLNEYLKGLWGRDGYERGNIDSSFGTDTMPILSGVFITGNEYPDDDALISRSVIEEFTKKDFTTEEKNEYKVLTKMSVGGVSSFLIDIFRHRELWEREFAEKQTQAERQVKADMRVLGANERTFQNYGVIGASYLLMQDKLALPFQWSEVLGHLTNCISTQVRKQASGGKVTRFWDTFLSCVRTKNDPILHYQDFRLAGNDIYVQMMNVYGRMQSEWFRMHAENAPPKGEMMELLKQDDAFVDTKGSMRFGLGSDGERSSALIFDLTKTNIHKDLMELLEFVDARNNKKEEQYVYKEPAKGSSAALAAQGEIPIPLAGDLPF